MLHAAAMLAGLFILGLVLTHGWASGEESLLVLVSALLSVAIAFRFGGVRKNPFSAAPAYVALIAGGTGEAIVGALTTIRAAAAADVTLKPALVRVRSDGAGPLAKAAAADLISAASGAVVIDTDRDGMLVHVMDEDAVDGGFGELQKRAAALLEGRT